MKFWSNSDVPDAGSFIPEKRLLAAVLQRAVTDFLTAEGDLKDSAENWLFGKESDQVALSFIYVCAALDMDEDNLRGAIKSQIGSAKVREKEARRRRKNQQTMVMH